MFKRSLLLIGFRTAQAEAEAMGEIGNRFRSGKERWNAARFAEGKGLEARIPAWRLRGNERKVWEATQTRRQLPTLFSLESVLVQVVWGR